MFSYLALYHLRNYPPLVPITRFSNQIAQLCYCQKMFECCIISPGMPWYHKDNNICSSVRVLFRKTRWPPGLGPIGSATSGDDRARVTIQTCQHLPRSQSVPGGKQIPCNQWWLRGHNAPPLSSDELAHWDVGSNEDTWSVSPQISTPGPLITSFSLCLSLSASEKYSGEKICNFSPRYFSVGGEERRGLAGQECLATIWEIFLNCSASHHNIQTTEESSHWVIRPGFY